jgi:hypothetical protein
LHTRKPRVRELGVRVQCAGWRMPAGVVAVVIALERILGCRSRLRLLELYCGACLSLDQVEAKVRLRPNCLVPRGGRVRSDFGLSIAHDSRPKSKQNSSPSLRLCPTRSLSVRRPRRSDLATLGALPQPPSFPRRWPSPALTSGLLAHSHSLSTRLPSHALWDRLNGLVTATT